MIYGARANNKAHGVVLTKPEVVEAMLDLLGYRPSSDLSAVTVLDPCGGEGAFICACIERLAESADRHRFSFAEAYSRLKVVELDAGSVAILRERIKATLQRLNKLTEIKNPGRIIVQGDFLLYDGPTVDIVVGNPPYVRQENLPDELKIRYRSLFSTFRHRSDLYIAFYQRGLQLLKPGGRLSFICANRWLKNQYGKSLRELIQTRYCFEVNINTERTHPFEEEVYGYASITQICNTSQNGPGCGERMIDSLDELCHLARQELHTFVEVQDHEASTSFPLALIEEQGFSIGIGVATGADKIFLGKHLPEHMEAEVLLPLVLGKDVQGLNLSWSGHYVFNPWDERGVLRDLDRYPRAKQYLDGFREQLSKRYIAQKHPQRWFQLIDKIKPELTHQPKILLADISKNAWVTIDEGKFYPHHNLYYISSSDVAELQLLACFLMTDFVREQLQRLSPLMSGGYARWQSQHLRKLRVPVLKHIPQGIRSQFLRAYSAHDAEQIQILTGRVLQLPVVQPESVSDYLSQLPLFVGMGASSS